MNVYGLSLLFGACCLILLEVNIHPTNPELSSHAPAIETQEKQKPPTPPIEPQEKKKPPVDTNQPGGAQFANELESAGEVLGEVLSIPDDIPQDLLDKSECVIVLPSVTKAVFTHGEHGRGVMTCRTGEHFTGPWSAPTMMVIEGGSFGFQLGGQATDFVLLVMNPRGAKAILHNKVKLGADASAAAGPKGRNAEAATDVTLRAEVLSYSRSRGLFAGLSLEGSTIRPDNSANEKVYRKKVEAEDIVRKGVVAVPPSAQQLIALLNKKSPKNLSDPESLK